MVTAGIDTVTNLIVFLWPLRTVVVPVTARLETSDLISRIVLGVMYETPLLIDSRRTNSRSVLVSQVAFDSGV